MQPTMPYIIGLTGGIGSGKSVVSRLLRLMGVSIYDCDSEAKRLMCQSIEIREALVEAVGSVVYRADGQLDRAYLASYMFGHAERVQQVNRIVHPVVRADFRQWADHSGCSIVAVESAILHEAHMEADVDSVWLVYAPEEIRVQRAITRDASNVEAVRKRIQNQLSETEHLRRADEIIYNDDRHSLILQVATLLEACNQG